MLYKFSGYSRLKISYQKSSFMSFGREVYYLVVQDSGFELVVFFLYLSIKISKVLEDFVAIFNSFMIYSYIKIALG